MIHRMLTVATVLVALLRIACPLAAVAQDTGWEENEMAPRASTALSGGYAALRNLFNPTVGSARLRVSDRVTWFPDEPVAAQSTHLGSVRQDFSAALPLWQDALNEWSAATYVRGEFFHTHAILPDTGHPFPEELWHVRLGAIYRHQFDNGWIGGGTLNVGSASDQPFASLHELFAGGSAFLRVPQGVRNAWLFSLSYAPTSELGIPLPGVAYLFHPSERLHAAIGLPLFVQYRPWDDLMLEASYRLLRTVHTRVTYRHFEPVRLFAGFDWSNESYRLADRLHDRDRQHLSRWDRATSA
jgi:hypothetical protein